MKHKGNGNPFIRTLFPFFQSVSIQQVFLSVIAADAIKRPSSHAYILPAAFLFDAFKAFIFFSSFGASISIWVAKLHLPDFHFISGWGYDAQYFPAGYSFTRPQPSQFVTMA
jgi:hypothetical protein